MDTRGIAMKPMTPRQQLLDELAGWLRAVPVGDWRAFISKGEVQLILEMARQLDAYERRFAADSRETQAALKATRRRERERTLP
jgi:hypothetical protein